MKHLTLVLGLLLLSEPAYTQVGLELPEQSLERQYQELHLLMQKIRITPELPIANIDPALSSQYTYDIEFSPDTLWSYEEEADSNTAPYYPVSYSLDYDVGTETEFKNYYKNFFWDRSSESWYMSSFYEQSYLNDFNDTTISFYYNMNGDITSGSRTIHMPVPAEGATMETYYQNYDPTQGWMNQSRSLVYHSAGDDSDYWTKNFTYVDSLDSYQLRSHTINQHTDEHQLYEYKNYIGGAIDYWTKEYTVLDNDGRPVYRLYYNYDFDSEMLVVYDSTSFIYHPTHMEMLKFNNNTGNWTLNNYSRTYESASAVNASGVKIDSVITYTATYDAENDSIIIINTLNKSEWLYNEADYATELRYYSWYGGNFIVYSKTVYTYEIFDGNYYSTERLGYNLNYSNYQLYLYFKSVTLYDDQHNYIGDASLNFSSTGDTTGGYSSKTLHEDNAMYNLQYSWKPEVHDWVINSYSFHLEEEPVFQFNYVSMDYSSNRHMSTEAKYPAAMNDGPLFLNIGDTLDFIISARNVDMSIPDVMVTDMPATAIYDPETKRFFWIVDEIPTEPMIYTATNSTGSTTTKIKFVGDVFTVPNESYTDLPDRAVLHPNYPNPFNPSTTITFEVPSATHTVLKIYSILGQEVATLVDGIVPQGVNTLTFDAAELSSGVYILSLQTEKKHLIQKMTLIK